MMQKANDVETYVTEMIVLVVTSSCSPDHNSSVKGRPFFSQEVTREWRKGVANCTKTP